MISPSSPPPTHFDLGFLGGGQLARMSIQAAQRMGLRCLSLDPGLDTPASQIAPAIQGKLDDPSKIAEVFSRCERVTLENEFIPGSAIREALRQSGRPEATLVPGVDALETIQDKLRQREALLSAGVPSPRAVSLDDEGARAKAEIGFPMVLKARFGGYDGKGTRYARTSEEFQSHRELWASGGWLAEEFVPFKRELAVMVSIAVNGEDVFPTMETRQVNHVCDLVLPCDADGESVALAAIQAIGGMGLFGVELFETEDGRILVNEIAPRPHNTGHYTLDWGGTSQFEQHVRVATGLTPRADVWGRPTCMANLLGQPGAGDFRKGLVALLQEDPLAHFHWYGKAEAKPGRKMGHLNVTASEDVTPEKLAEDAIRARDRFYEAWTSDK